MTPESEDNLQLEIGHVLFIDIVGYSKLLIEEQKERLRRLTEIVLETEQVRSSTEEQLVRLPTGDGMALVFRHSSEEPVRCALEIARALKAQPEIAVRMGIHSGPVSEVTDVSGRANIAGAGINMAQRVMDCGDAGHILLSRRVAGDLEQYREWQPQLHELGECEVKHGVRLMLVNLYTGEAGNSAMPEKFKQNARTRIREAKRFGGILALLALLGAVITAFGFYFLSQRTIRKAPAASPMAAPSEKSIAVLPFENLSHDPDNAYFADGIQEEILTRLASIAQLKVISRTSTAKYKGRPEDLKTVANALGVATVLEGSVQKANDQVRVNVQLINAASDAHLWADTYDRKLTNIFAVETEIATKIAETLQAKLTGKENAAVAVRPTENTEAHELYLRARYLVAKGTYEDTAKAIEYYNQAISQDPNYALAYAGLGDAYADITSYTRLAARETLTKARSAAEKALALNASLPEAHISLGEIALAQFKMREAKSEFDHAIKLNPNSAEAHSLLAVLLTALGKFDAAITEGERAVELDPLSLATRTQLGTCYRRAGRLPEAIDVFRKTIELDPAYAQAQDGLGVALENSGDLDAAIAQFQRSFAASGGDFHSLVFLSHAYAVKGERDKAMQTLQQTKELEQKHGAEWAWGYALIYLGLGDKEQAINWLERSYQTNESFAILLYIRVEPLLAPLHGHPRFEKLADTIMPASE